MNNAGAQRIGIKDVARICGVGTSTVSKVINGKGEVSAEKREFVLNKVRELGYVPSPAARRMGSGRLLEPLPTQTIEISMGEIGEASQFHSELLHHLAVEAAGMGYRVIASFTSTVSADPPDGVVQVFGAPRRSAAPAVTVDWLSEDPLVAGVIPDYEAGYYRATKVALDRGYRSPMLLLDRFSPTDSQHFFSMTYRGYSRALLEQGLKPSDHVLGRNAITAVQGYEEARRILDSADRPDLICANDDAAVGVYKAAAELGLRIPEDLGVLGCDGLPVGKYLHPTLATVATDLAQLARETVSRLLAAINRTAGPWPQKLLMPTEFKDNPSLAGRGRNE